ncbi:MAG: ABC transporter permease [Anaerolineaceae bacterium]|nr:ABC transporter permease [Anaerolineaceae bacterium]
MSLYLRLAWRNFWRHRRRTLIVMLAIGLTIAMMIMYDGTIAGFNQAIYANAIRVMGGNIQVHAAGYRAKEDENPLLPLTREEEIIKAALAQPQVEAASLRIQTTGLATSPEGAFAVSIVGIEPEKEQPVSLLADPKNIPEGRFLTSTDGDAVFIGLGLSKAMNIKTGDRFTLTGKDTNDQMRKRTMTVVGIYSLGMGEIEKRSIYISLAEAQDLYGLSGQSTEVVITLKRLGEESSVVKALTPQLPESEVESWEKSYPELQMAISTKGAAMDVFSVIMLFIAGIGILNLLMMAVFERTREIGILGALGMKPRQITWLFLLEGSFMALMGVGLGVALGVLFNFVLMQIGLDYSAFASMTEYTALINGRIYPSLGLEKLPMRAITALVVSLIASYYPATQAARHEPAQALHFV